MLEIIHNYTNNHPLISIFVLMILIGIVVILVGLRNAELIDEETEKAYKIALLKDYFKNENLNYEKVLNIFNLTVEKTQILMSFSYNIDMTDDEILKVKKILNNI